MSLHTYSQTHVSTDICYRPYTVRHSVPAARTVGVRRCGSGRRQVARQNARRAADLNVLPGPVRPDSDAEKELSHEAMLSARMAKLEQGQTSLAEGALASACR